MSRGVAIICALAAGGLVALQPPANAMLARHVSDLGAAFVSLAISLVIIGVLLLVAGHPGRLAQFGGFRFAYLLGGIAGAAVVGVSLVAVRPLGAGGLIALLVAAQLVVSVLADRFGWFDLPVVAIGPGRVLGLALVIGGTVLITR
ncbi:MAG TPA: DMT family transporter [Solirubrobacteraceae bacterium]|nr:DMT family transporter [Solirubrobacteraceae bacterium]